MNLLELADRNFAASLREHARWSEHGVIEEHDGTQRTLSGTRFPAGVFNAVFCLGQTPSDPTTWLAEQLNFFARAGRGGTVFTREVDRTLATACEAAQLTAGPSPVMAIEAPVDAPSIAIDVVDDLTPWIEVQASAFASLGVPENVVHETMTPARMHGDHVSYLLARDGGAGAMVLHSDGIAGLYWVGVRPEQRRRGLGEAVTRAATNLAFERGAGAVVLQASEMGFPVYEALGYRTITSYSRFLARRRRD